DESKEERSVKSSATEYKDHEMVVKSKEEVCPIVNAPPGRLVGAYDLRVAIPRVFVHAGDMTIGDARSWYMINGDAKSWTHEIGDVYLTAEELHQLNLDEEALKETLEEQAVDEKAREDKNKQKQAEDDELFSVFGVVRYDSEYESSD
nr:hypothetical protein [Tanacetum cinerariifolium]